MDESAGGFQGLGTFCVEWDVTVSDGWSQCYDLMVHIDNLAMNFFIAY